MERVHIRLPGTEGRGYSATKAYDNKGIYISLGGDSRPGGSRVAIIHDEYVEIVLYDGHADAAIEDYKKSRETQAKLDAWAKRCVKKMYVHMVKILGATEAIKQVAEHAYEHGFRVGDADRLYKIRQALGG